MKEVWNELPSSVIKKCWDHAGILNSDDTTSRKIAIDLLVNASDECELEKQIVSLF